MLEMLYDSVVVENTKQRDQSVKVMRRAIYSVASGCLIILLVGCGDLSLSENILVPTMNVEPTATTAEQAPAILVATPTPEVEEPVVSGQIMFVSNRTGNNDIYRMNADGSGLARLTDNRANDTDPTWSPDGRQLAFVSDRTGTTQVHTMNIDGANIQQMTDESEGITAPVWSPDGQQLAFVVASSTIVIRALESDEISRLTDLPPDIANLSWSPDGRYLAFSASDPTDEANRDIFIRSLDADAILMNLTNQQGSDDFPDWSPDSSRLAFQSDRDGNMDVFVMNADGTLQTPLTTDTSFDGEPTWSQDGQQLAFVSMRDGNRDLYVINDAGAEVESLALHPAADTQPAWQPLPPQPQSEQLVFASNDVGALRDIFMTNTTGIGITELTSDLSVDDMTPNWSPDGQQLVFASSRDGNYDLFTINVEDPSEPINMTTNPGADLHPVWSPDGTRIAFESNRDGNWEVYIINVDGTEVVNLSNNAIANDGNPTWSPDGNQVAFTSDRDGDFDIYVMNTDGSGQPTQLTNNTINDVFPAWSPDGARIVFRSERDENQDIYIMNTSGRQLRRLTRTTANEDHPTWSPDGTRIAFVSNRLINNNGAVQPANFNLYTMDTNGGNVIRITQSPTNELYPAWRP